MLCNWRCNDQNNKFVSAIFWKTHRHEKDKERTWLQEHFLTLYDWLSTYPSFDRLRSIFSWIIVLDNDSLINCNNTKRIRISFHKGLDAIFLHAAKIKSKSKVQPIDSLCNTVVIKEGKYITLKPSALFTRFTAVAQREDDMKKVFEYEMTAITMSLFKDWMMYKPNICVTIL